MIKNQYHSPGYCKTRLVDLSVKYGQTTILQQVSLEIGCGEMVALIGPNGAGKSTLLRCLVGEISYTGQILFNQQQRTPVIGYVPQRIHFEKDNPMSVLDLFSLAHSKWPIFLFASQAIKQRAIKVLTAVEAQHLLHRQIAQLSGGELRRVLLALAMTGDPELLVLDEPDAGIDTSGTALFYALLDKLRKQYDIAILMVSHDFKIVHQYANQIVLLEQGHIVQRGTPTQVMSSHDFCRLFPHLSPLET